MATASMIASAGAASTLAIERENVEGGSSCRPTHIDNMPSASSQEKNLNEGAGDTLVCQPLVGDDSPSCDKDEENFAGFNQESVQQMFDEFDTDRDGLIDLKDFEQVLHRLGVGTIYGSDEIQKLAMTADANGDGYIDVTEFSVWLQSFGDTASPCSGAQAVVSNHAEDTDVRQQYFDEDMRDRLLRMQERLRKANVRATEAEAEVSDAKSHHNMQLQRTEDRFTKAEAILEEQGTAALQFWRMVAGTSATATLGKALDMSILEVIGSGRYSYVVKSKRVKDGSDVVAKLLSLRWLHVAQNEWYVSQIIGEHPNILKAELDDVWLHSDGQSDVAKVILSAVKEGKLRSKGKAQFPNHYVCLLYELMNCGTVQDWMDNDRLSPEGLLSVVQQISCALAHMHQHGVSHNDVKPQNLFLTREDDSNPNSKVIVKLADLGLGAKCADHNKDISQFVMTLYCMATGEPFGAQKLNTMINSLGQLLPELVNTFVASLVQLTVSPGATPAPTPSMPCAAAAAEGTGVGRQRVDLALGELPGIVRGLCEGTMVIAEVKDFPLLQGWSITDGDSVDE